MKNLCPHHIPRLGGVGVTIDKCITQQVVLEMQMEVLKMQKEIILLKNEKLKLQVALLKEQGNSCTLMSSINL